MVVVKIARILAAAARHPVGAAGARVIALDGRSGSGKTTLAGELAAELEPNVAVVHTDAMLGGWEGLPELGQRLADDLLRPFLAGKPGRYRRFDWEAYRWAADVMVPTAPWLIVEGVGAGSLQCEGLVSLLVWLAADREVRLERCLGREADSFGGNWDRWEREERSHFTLHDTRRRADLVIST